VKQTLNPDGLIDLLLSLIHYYYSVNNA